MFWRLRHYPCGKEAADFSWVVESGNDTNFISNTNGFYGCCRLRRKHARKQEFPFSISRKACAGLLNNLYNVNNIEYRLTYLLMHFTVKWKSLTSGWVTTRCSPYKHTHTQIHTTHACVYLCWYGCTLTCTRKKVRQENEEEETHKYEKEVARPLPGYITALKVRIKY